MNDKSGIQGAINTDLLQLQVDELSVKFNVYKDKVTRSHLLSSVESNKKKMIELTESLNYVYADACKWRMKLQKY